MEHQNLNWPLEEDNMPCTFYHCLHHHKITWVCTFIIIRPTSSKSLLLGYSQHIHCDITPNPVLPTPSSLFFSLRSFLARVSGAGRPSKKKTHANTCKVTTWSWQSIAGPKSVLLQTDAFYIMKVLSIVYSTNVLNYTPKFPVILLYTSKTSHALLHILHCSSQLD